MALYCFANVSIGKAGDRRSPEPDCGRVQLLLDRDQIANLASLMVTTNDPYLAADGWDYCLQLRLVDPDDDGFVVDQNLDSSQAWFKDLDHLAFLHNEASQTTLPRLNEKIAFR